MRIHFVFPRWQKLLEAHPQLKEEISGYEIGSFRMASLGIPTAIAALPPGVEVTFHDQNLEEVRTDVDADLFAVGFFTPQAASAYRLADELRARGVPTLAGGIHPTMAPDDTLRHFDAVVVGEVEGLWERILADLARGELTGRYERLEGPPPLGGRQPRRDVFDGSRYLRTGVVQIARGCRHRCSYCVVPTCYGTTVRQRPIGEVVDDIRSLPYSNYFLADESFVFDHPDDRAYALELCDALARADTGKTFYVAAYPWMLKDVDAEMMQAMRRAGCRQIYGVLGLDSPLRRELASEELLQKIAELREQKIELMGSFILGHDGDDVTSKELVISFCEQARMNLVELAIATPFPGTPQFAAMKREGRILHEDWGLYNCANVVFKPKRFEIAELEKMFLDLWRHFYAGVDPLEMKRRYARAFSRGILESKAW